MEVVIRGLIAGQKVDPDAVSGVLVGWVGQGSHAPTIGRVSVLKAGLPEKAHAFTIQANCVSSLESVCSAYRHLVMGEGTFEKAQITVAQPDRDHVHEHLFGAGGRDLEFFDRQRPADLTHDCSSHGGHTIPTIQRA